jgi:hypothetical protein
MKPVAFKLIDVKVDWMPEYSNDPWLTFDFGLVYDNGHVDSEVCWYHEDAKELISNEVFDREDFRLLCVQGDRARYYVWCEKERGGFGGATFNFKLMDGKELVNVGAWASRPSIMHQVFHTPLIHGGSNLGAQAATVDSIIRWAKEQLYIPFSIWKVNFLKHEDEIAYIIGYSDGSVKNPNAHTYLERLL